MEKIIIHSYYLNLLYEERVFIYYKSEVSLTQVGGNGQ